MAESSPDETPRSSPRTTRGGSIVTQKQRWPSVRHSAARKSGMEMAKKLSKKPPPVGELKIRSVSGVQTFFKERTLSKADAYIRDRTASEGHLFLKALAPNAPFLDVLKREPPFPKESSSSEESYHGILDEELAGLDKKAVEAEATGIKMPPPPPEDLDDVCLEWSKKPFVMPSDDKIYHIRALLKQKERADFVKSLSQSVIHKTTAASRASAVVGSDRLRKQLKEMDKQMEMLLVSLKQAPSELQTCYFHRDKESLQEFVQKKREIFFVQMSLDTKRSEIRKLEERIFQREEALRKSEEMLEEDGIEFNSFLKKNDEKTQEALKKAEKNTRLKQDKLAEIKKINTETGIVRAEVSKYEEQLEECKKYKAFLLKITPIDWFEEQAKLKAERDAERAKIIAEGDEPPPLPDEEEEVTYFQHPHQLMEVYNDIEATNLALLQLCQETEGMLESFKYKTRSARAIHDAEINSLKAQLSVLQNQVWHEEDKQAALKKKASINVEGTEHEITFEMLCTKVLSTFLRIGLDADPSLTALQMLTMIEARMEEGMTMLKTIPQEFIRITEKAREKERREKAREDNMAALKAMAEERRIRSLERAKAPIFKRIGKPPMPRSFLPKKKKKGVDVKLEVGDDAELAEFLARDY